MTLPNTSVRRKSRSGVAVCQLFVIETELIEDRGLHIVDVNRVLGRMEPEVVRFADCHTGFDATPGHPDGERLRMVIGSPRLRLEVPDWIRPWACGQTHHPTPPACCRAAPAASGSSSTSAADA